MRHLVRELRSLHMLAEKETLLLSWFNMVASVWAQILLLVHTPDPAYLGHYWRQKWM